MRSVRILEESNEPPEALQSRRDLPAPPWGRTELYRSLAELQGGALKIRSTEGVGTIVSVRIPVKKAALAVKAAA